MGIPDIDLCNYRTLLLITWFLTHTYCGVCVGGGGGGVRVYPVLLRFCYILQQNNVYPLANRNV